PSQVFVGAGDGRRRESYLTGRAGQRFRANISAFPPAPPTPRGVRRCDTASHERTVKCRGGCLCLTVSDLESIICASPRYGREIAQVSPAPCVSPAGKTQLRGDLSMPKIESMRDVVSSWPSYEYVKNHEAAGWRLVAVEWQREVDGESTEPVAVAHGLMEEIPYGTRIASDCLHLQDNPTEMQILNHLAEMIVQDVSYTHMAESLNQRGFRTREGKTWTSLAVFKLTPRLIEVAPRILSGAEWESRKRQLHRVAWNS